MQSQRSHRVAELIQQELARLMEFKAQDPRFKKVTVTFVDLSPDLRSAKIYVLSAGDNNSAAVVTALNKAQGFFRSEIAKNLDLRYAPKLNFIYDESISRGAHLSGLINKI